MSSLLHKLCAKAQEWGGSEGVRQWHREEPELGTARLRKTLGICKKGVRGQGSPSERSKAISGVKSGINRGGRQQSKARERSAVRLEPGKHWEWESPVGRWEQPGRRALGCFLSPRRSLHHHTSPLHLLPALPGLCHRTWAGTRCSPALELWNKLPGKAGIHIPEAHTAHLGVDSAEVEAETEASSEGMCCLLLAITAGFPISSGACSLQERLEQPGN